MDCQLDGFDTASNRASNVGDLFRQRLIAMSIYENTNRLVESLIGRYGAEGTVNYLTNLITSMNYELNFTQQQTDRLETLLKQRRSEISQQELLG